MKKLLLIIILLCSGCSRGFWHPDNRVRIKPTSQVDYTQEELDAIRYYLLERIHAYQRATTSVEPSSLPSKANLADDERGAPLRDWPPSEGQPPEKK